MPSMRPRPVSNPVKVKTGLGLGEDNLNYQMEKRKGGRLAGKSNLPSRPTDRRDAALAGHPSHCVLHALLSTDRHRRTASGTDRQTDTRAPGNNDAAPA